MDSLKHSLDIQNKIRSLMDTNNGVITITFFDNTKKTIKILSSNVSGNPINSTGTITTFSDNINETTDYNIQDIKDVS